MKFPALIIPLLLSAMLAALPAVSSAAPIATYDFSVLAGTRNDWGGNVDTDTFNGGVILSGSTEASVAANMTLGDLTNGTSTLAYSTASQVDESLDLALWDTGGDGNDRWMDFTITADSGFAINVDSVSIRIRRNGAGAAEQMAFDVSVDGGAFVNYGGGDQAATTTLTTFTFTEAIAGAETVTFRFVPHGPAGSTGNTHIHALSVEGAVVDGSTPDSDNDGLLDSWEIAHFGNLDQSGTDDWPDLDGLDNTGEQERGTNPTLADTDGDGFNDKAETGTGTWVDANDTGTDPLSPDTDGDGLPDGVETRTGTFVNGLDTGTDPHLFNTDGDRIGDGTEVARGTDPTSSASQPDLPNVVFIMADDMGYNHLSCYGQQRIQTPHIDTLAAGGMRFTDAYAGGAVCGPSRSSLMSGMHGGHLPVQANAGYTDITDRTTTLGEVFKNTGYATGYFGKWGIGGPGSGQTPNDRGFDEFLGMLDHGHGHIHYPHYLVHNLTKEPTGNTTVTGRLPKTNPNPAFRVQHTHDALSNAALQFIDDHRDEAFFCFLSFTLPHTEIIANPAAVSDITDNLHPVWDGLGLTYDNYTASTDVHISQSKPHTHFAAELRMIDNTVGAVLAKLDTLGLTDNTLVIFTSDNGGQLRPVWGNAPSYFFEANGILRGGKATVYEGGLRVPFIAKWPGRVPVGTTSNLPHYFADMLPTMCELLGNPPPAYTDGLSILPTLIGDNAIQKHHRYMCWLELGKRAIRSGRWKAVKNGGGAIELYDLDTDPSETSNVAGANPGIVAEMQRIIDREFVPELPTSERPSYGAPAYPDFPE